MLEAGTDEAGALSGSGWSTTNPRTAASSARQTRLCLKIQNV